VLFYSKGVLADVSAAWNQPREIVCTRCGAKVTTAAKNTLYCAGCRQIAMLERAAVANRKARARKKAKRSKS
jgi:hypothetical protein